MEQTMLSDEEKKEMLEDAKDQARRKAFAQARNRTLNQLVSGAQYLRFLQGVQNFFPHKKSPKKIEGAMFKL